MNPYHNPLAKSELEEKVERIPTNIIDPLLMGGIPRGSVVLLIGDPKSGKTTFISQFIYNQLISGANVISLLVDIPRYEFISNALDFGWNFITHLNERLHLLDAYTQRIRGGPKFSFTEEAIPDIRDTSQIIDIIKDTTTRILLNNPHNEEPLTVGIISSLTPMFFETEKKEIYKFLEDLKAFSHKNKQVWIIEMNSGVEEPQVETIIKAIVDGIIEMRLFEENHTLQRYLRVYGMRRTRHLLSWVPYDITDKGIVLKLE
ncbi:RAD55 family ATPase [Thermococcus argininiproducens]|uniref:RAD55 family ATPase n=1 Tax=Thermococcus argininiproducens TaxID=2866384 RepID=A0A9E7MAK0_9EURY|nr:RAD55 family ATPase [Thermococcus argininiproducens]USH00209.1 RAD55 family ATPase [Thermococcus argininiproducens]